MTKEQKQLLAAAGGVAFVFLLNRPSPHFTWAELETTSQPFDNTPPPDARVRLFLLCWLVLEPLRAQFGPILVTSAFRSEAVNTAIGGSEGSLHKVGQAADVYSSRGYSNAAMAGWLYQQKHIPLYEVVVEEHTGHLHIGMDLSPKRFLKGGKRNFLVTYDGKTYSIWRPA